MKLSPREKDKLLISLAAMVAKNRLDRGVKLNYPETIAIISDFVIEGARDGKTVAALMELGAHVVKKKDSYPFKVPKGINFVIVDSETGAATDKNTKKAIYESFKSKGKIVRGLENKLNKDKLGLYDIENEKKLLRFY